MVYLDSSVAVAHLTVENRRPTSEFWAQPLISSRLLEYEVMNKVDQPGTPPEIESDAQALLQRIAFIELIPEILRQSREPRATMVRTLDTLHIASALFLINEGVQLELASYDERMRKAAIQLGIPLAKL